MGELKTVREDVWDSEMILYDTTVLETCHYTFVKTHRMNMRPPRMNPNVNYGSG